MWMERLFGSGAVRGALLPALGLLAIGAAATAVAQDGGAGVQVTPDAERVLVNKDVGAERWAITRNRDGTVTGNVFRADGGPPSFVWCEPTDDDDVIEDFIEDLISDLIGGDDDEEEGTLNLSCFGADSCTVAPCSETQWVFIADVSLPETFFRP